MAYEGIGFSSKYGVITASRPYVRSIGASNGPRVVTSAFSVTRHGANGPLSEAQVAIDLDANIFQEEVGVRRRAGRAAVPIAKRTATLILEGAIKPDVDKSEYGGPWMLAQFSRDEFFEGFQRRARARVYYRASETTEPHLVPEAAVKRACAAMRNLAEGLHGSIDDPAFGSIFGVR